jgi:hypothetical protein
MQLYATMQLMQLFAAICSYMQLYATYATICILYTTISNYMQLYATYATMQLYETIKEKTHTPKHSKITIIGCQV